MKTLRRVFIVLGAIALFLLGLDKLGGVPITSGYDTGFSAALERSPEVRLALTTDTSNLTCWLKLRVPAQNQSFSAKLSNDAPLRIYQESNNGSDQWIAIVAPGQKPQEQFNWPAGTTILIYSADNNPQSLLVNNWYVFLSDKDYDSKSRAQRRTYIFVIALVLLPIALVGVGLEAYAKLKDEHPLFTSQRCIEELIESTAGQNSKETKWMKSILTKVLLEGIPVKDALDTLPLKKTQKLQLWFKTRNQFLNRLTRLVSELDGYQTELNRY